MKMKPAGIWLCLLCLFSLVGLSCDDGNNRSADNPLPPDPNEWACESPPPPQADIDALCASASDFGLPAPDYLRSPVPIDLLDDKNIYDIDMRDFLRVRGYVNELGWLGDLTWRFTGPYVGPIGNGQSYGVHPAVKIYYSPEMMEWLCGGRQGEVPDGSIIVKEMHSINDELEITIDSEGCMVINADVLPTSWTVMVKQNGASHDGWYWANYTEAADPQEYFWQSGNPPIFDRSAVTNIEFFGGMTVPVEPNPLWYPTGYLFESKTKLPDIVPAFSSYGNSCINCHASAEAESTFISLDNLLTPGLRYKHYDSAQVENPHDDSPHVPGKFIAVNAYTAPRADGEVDSYVSPFSTALKEPNPEFIEFYNQLAEISFSEVWDLRLPAETYDHVLPGPGAADGFITSDQCIACHDATISNSSLPNMIFQEAGPDGTENINLSPYGEWKASPMGLAGRDPVFFSQLESETNHLPELTECIENTCLHCHGVMGQRQLATDTEGEFDERCKDLFVIPPPEEVPFGRPFRLDMVKQWPNSEDNTFQKYAGLARDGISCTVCHRISDTDLGDESSFTGNFVTGPPDEVYGPYEDSTIIPLPMENAIGVTPRFSAHFKSRDAASSDLCGTCHNILLPVISNEGEVLGASYEQSTHLEWINSDFAPGRENFKSCADCHMQTSYKGHELAFDIANIESDQFAPTTFRLPDEDITLTKRFNYARHSLHGLNIFLNEMFQQFPVILGYRQIDYMTGTLTVPSLVTGSNSMIDMAANETAEVNVQSFGAAPDGKLRAVIEISNLTGHYLPSGVGFRRMFIEVLVRDAAGDILWASGRTNEIGALLVGRTNEILPSEDPAENPGAPQYQPHYQIITAEDEVQIYQEVFEDSDGVVTTSFLRRVDEVKDNRIRPLGYDPAFFLAPSFSPYVQELAELHGEVKFDPHYFDPALTGSDVIEYLISLDDETLARVHDVSVTLYYQSIPPPYLAERFRDASAGPAASDEIRRLQYITSHLNVNDTVDENGRPVIKDWKFFITADTRTLEQ